jgi:uncharacterized protein YbjT (DUF2867 family)
VSIGQEAEVPDADEATWEYVLKETTDEVGRPAYHRVKMTRSILVVGATGHVGRHVVEQLRSLGAPARALARRPETAGLPADVEVVAGDLTVPESLEQALDSVSAVFLLWTAPPATAEAVVGRIAARARRIVLLSSPHQTPHPFFQQPNPLARFHAELDRLVTSAGVEWTILRPGMFASNAIGWWAAAIRQGDVVRWPYGEAETAPIDERDIAAVAARALLDDGHAGRDYVLTGPASLTQAQQVDAIGGALGRRLRFEELSPAEFRMATSGRWPERAVDMLLAAWGATIGHRAYVTPTVAEVTGTPARIFREWARDYADDFR